MRGSILLLLLLASCEARTLARPPGDGLLVDPKSYEPKKAERPRLTLERPIPLRSDAGALISATGTRIEVSILSEEQALKLFAEIRNDERLKPFFQGRLDFGTCAALAHYMSLQMARKKVLSAKVFAEGSFLSRAKDPWSYHVAPVVLVKRNNELQTWVIDPALFDRPVGPEEWRDRLLGKGRAPAAAGQKYELESIYFNPRFNYWTHSTPEGNGAMTAYDRAEIDDMYEKLGGVCKGNTPGALVRCVNRLEEAPRVVVPPMVRTPQGGTLPAE